MEILVRLIVQESIRVPYPNQQAALLLRQLSERLENGEPPPITARHDNGLVATLKVVRKTEDKLASAQLFAVQSPHDRARDYIAFPKDA